MNVKSFLDTNILAYSFDLTSPKKASIANDLVALGLEGQSIISFQVVQEFINFALKTQSNPMNLSQIKQYYLKVLKPLCSVESSAKLYLRALELRKETNFSWYDSVILASAEEGDCGMVYSEDMQHNRKVGEVTIINPFK